eukprot:CAMPEP_0119564312 /NCGR_PEP_ID=MMETSP1352-20130426/26601_1 /TAXON_ID=265584 /ORGANISM="Stauroneis constricta, Strain CCMP1120" /LENGTH=593 /DNA_ID=CAMNT_0007613057 /DNA_START=52 /DNA_END=1833 /DNA_ORIENTATION=+
MTRMMVQKRKQWDASASANASANANVNDASTIASSHNGAASNNHATIDEGRKKNRSSIIMAYQRVIFRFWRLPVWVQILVLILSVCAAVLSLVAFCRYVYPLNKITTAAKTMVLMEYGESVDFLLTSGVSGDDHYQHVPQVYPVYNGTFAPGRHPRLVRLPSSYTLPKEQREIVQKNGKRVFSASMLADYEFQLGHNVTRDVGYLPAPRTRRINEKYDPLTNFARVAKLSAISPMDRDTCHASAEWQRGHRPTCNIIHEVMTSFDSQNMGASSNTYGKRLRQAGRSVSSTMTKSEREHWQNMQDDIDENGHARLVAGGAFRHVWMIREFDGTKRALKTLRVDSKYKKFDLRSFDRHRRDAMSMEQLTKSPLIVDIFGHCSNSGLFMWGDKGALSTIFEEMPHISELEMLKVAHNVSLSISHAHNFDSQGRPTIAHTDIKPDQFLFEDGYYKLTDFNRVRFLKWDDYYKKICGFNVGKNGGIWRSPEEYAYKPETEKVDVYSMGNVLFFLLTQDFPWDDYDKETVYKKVKGGHRPPVPDEILEKKDDNLFVKTMLKAIDMAFTYDARERPGAKEIAEAIQAGVDEMIANGRTSR